MQSSHFLIPLLAAVAFLGPLAAVLLHRPRPKRNVLLLLFAIPAMMWSVADFLLRAGLLPNHQLTLVKVVICLAVLMTVQYHLFLRSNIGGRGATAMLAYLPLFVTVGLTVSGCVPRSIDIGPEVVEVRYGVWMLPVVLALVSFIARDVYLLLRRRMGSSQATERNQIAYLLVATALGSAGVLMGFTPLGTEYASSHLSNLSMALVLAYAMVVSDLVDIGVALRRALAGFWIVASAATLNVLLLWLASVVLDFSLEPSLAIGTVVVTMVCIAFAHYASPYSRQAIDLLLLGRRHEYRQQLSRFVSIIAADANVNEFGNGLLRLLSRSVAGQRAWLLLPASESGDFQTRCFYASDGTELASSVTLARSSSVVVRLERERRCLHRAELYELPEFTNPRSIGNAKGESPEVDMVFPVLNQSRLVAIVVLGKKEDGGSYALEDEETVKESLVSIGAVMDQAVSRERMLHREEDLTVLNELATIITSSSDMRDVFDRFSQKLGTVAPVDLASVALTDENELYLFAVWARESFPWRVGQRIPLSGTGTERVVRERKSLLEPDLARNSLSSSAGQEFAGHGIRSVLHLPLILGDRGIGVLIVGSRQPDAYSGRIIALLERLAAALVKPIDNSRCYAETKEHARVDQLTGLYNRRHLEARLKEEVSLYTRHRDCFSLVMLDLDAFKMYNDAFGHPAGDDLLKRIAGVIARSIRTGDQAFRYGGDEFAILLPNTDLNAAGPVTERVRQQIEHHMNLAFTGVSASIGFAGCPANGVTADDLVAMADAALYHAKYHGGNCSSAATDLQPGNQVIPRTQTRGPSLAAVYALMAVVDARDHYTYAHSLRVRSYAVTLTKAVGTPAEVRARVGVAAMLHDVGKIGARDGVLASGKAATPEEIGELRAHPRLGASIVSGVPSLIECVPAILYHHEWYDGSGYPEGLAGENIPLEARILAVADAFANMVAERDGHAALPWEEALEELKRYAGTRFDPRLVEPFVDATIESEALLECQSSVSLPESESWALAQKP